MNAITGFIAYFSWDPIDQFIELNIELPYTPFTDLKHKVISAIKIKDLCYTWEIISTYLKLLFNCIVHDGEGSDAKD